MQVRNPRVFLLCAAPVAGLVAVSSACRNPEREPVESGALSEGLHPSDGDDDDDDDDGTPGTDDDGMGLDVGSSDPTDPGSTEFSYIWIANSPQGTVSKIDTVTLEEHGRYQVNPAPSDETKGGPSRTSVNLDGDMVVIDRDGGLVKIWATPDRCQDGNGEPGIQTSTDDGFLGWDGDTPLDDCIAWRLEDTLKYGRSVAWTIPEVDPDGAAADPYIWAAYPIDDQEGEAEVLLVTTDGAVEERIAVPDCNCPEHGPYGGAVDPENNLWFVVRDGSPPGIGGKLFRVDYMTHDVTSYTRPENSSAYGIAIDSEGRVWIAGDDASLVRFDPDTDDFVEFPLDGIDNDYVLRGLMQHKNGDIFIAAMSGWDVPSEPEPGLLRVDGDSGDVVEFIGRSVIPEIVKPAGIAVDHQGLVWLVDTDANSAFRVDPETNEYDVFDELVLPYTYSDMTGFALANVDPVE